MTLEGSKYADDNRCSDTTLLHKRGQRGVCVFSLGWGYLVCEEDRYQPIARLDRTSWQLDPPIEIPQVLYDLGWSVITAKADDDTLLYKFIKQVYRMPTQSKLRPNQHILS